MNVLLVFPEIPWPLDHGGRIATYRLYLQGLTKNGHTVDAVIAVQPGQQRHEDVLQKSLRRVVYVDHRPPLFGGALRLAASIMTLVPYAQMKFMPRKMPAVVDATLRARPYDVIIAEHEHIADAVPTNTKIPFLVHFQNINSDLYSRTAAAAGLSVKGVHSWLQAMMSRRHERHLCRRLTGVVVASREDEVSLRRLGVQVPIHVVPYGIDTSSVSQSGPAWAWPEAPPNVPLVVMTGSMDYYPNVDGARFLVHRIMPRVWAQMPNARVALVGRDPGPEVRELAAPSRVMVTGHVPDVRPYLEAASVVVVPLRTGSGIRIKALEAAALAKPIVGTTIGLEGLAFVNGASAVIADSPADIAQAIALLLNDPVRRNNLGQEALRLVRSRYDWRVCAEALDRVVTSVAAQPRSRV